MVRAGSAFLLIGILGSLLAGVALAAQSSKDIPLSQEEILAVGKRILGSEEKLLEAEEYVIGHGDILSVQIYGEGDMSLGIPIASRSGQEPDSLRSASSGAQVRIDGRISLRHIGDVQAVGFTLTQLADYLKELYSSVFDDPIITVALVQSNSQRYTVMGKVARPGIYYLDYPINLVQVVARSGGFTEWAKNEIRLVRKRGGKDSRLFNGNTLSFDYDDFLDGENLEKNILVTSGDIIIVR